MAGTPPSAIVAELRKTYELPPYPLDDYIKALTEPSSSLTTRDLGLYLKQVHFMVQHPPYVAREFLKTFEHHLARLLGTDSVSGCLLDKYNPKSPPSATKVDEEIQYQFALEEAWADLQQSRNATETHANTYMALTRAKRRLIGFPPKAGYLMNTQKHDLSTWLKYVIQYASTSSFLCNNVGIRFGMAKAWLDTTVSIINDTLIKWRDVHANDPNVPADVKATFSTLGINEYYCRERLQSLLYFTGVGHIAFPTGNAYTEITPVAERMLLSKTPKLPTTSSGRQLRDVDLLPFNTCNNLSSDELTYGIALLLDHFDRIEPQTPWWNMVLLSGEAGTEMASLSHNGNPEIGPETRAMMQPLVSKFDARYEDTLRNRGYRRVLIAPMNTNKNPMSDYRSAHWILVVIVIEPWDPDATRMYVFDSMSPGGKPGADPDSLSDFGRPGITRLRENLNSLGTPFFTNMVEVGFATKQNQKGNECGGRTLAAMASVFGGLTKFLEDNEALDTADFYWSSILDHGLCRLSSDDMATGLGTLPGIFSAVSARYLGTPEVATLLDLVANSPSNPAYKETDAMNLGLMSIFFKDYTLDSLKRMFEPNDLFSIVTSISPLIKSADAGISGPAYTFVKSEKTRTILSFLVGHVGELKVEGIRRIYALFYLDLFNDTLPPALMGLDWTPRHYASLFWQLQGKEFSDSSWFDENQFYGFLAPDASQVFNDMKLVEFIEVSGQLSGINRGFQDATIQDKLDQLIIVHYPPPLVRPKNVKKRAFIAINELVNYMSSGFHEMLNPWDTHLNMSRLLLPPPNNPGLSAQEIVNATYAQNVVTPMMRYFLYKRIKKQIRYVLTRITRKEEKIQGAKTVGIKGLVEVAVNIVQTQLASNVDGIVWISPQRFNEMKILLDQLTGNLTFFDGTSVSVDEIMGRISPYLDDSRRTPLSKFRKWIEKTLNDYNTQRVAAGAGIAVLETFTQRRFVASSNELLALYKLASLQDIDDFFKFSNKLLDWNKDQSKDLSLQDHETTLKWNRIFTPATVNVDPQFWASIFKDILVESDTIAKLLNDDIQYWKANATTVGRYFPIFDAYIKSLPDPTVTLAALDTLVNQKKKEWDTLLAKVKTTETDLYATAMGINELDPTPYYIRDPTIDNWLIVQNHDAAIDAAINDTEAILNQAAPFQKVANQLLDDNTALNTVIRNDLHPIIVSGRRLGVKESQAIKNIYAAYGITKDNPVVTTHAVGAMIKTRVQQEMPFRWKEKEYNQRTTARRYNDIVPGTPVDLRLLKVSLDNTTNFLLASVPPSMEDLTKETRLLQQHIDLMRKELDSVKNELETHVTVQSVKATVRSVFERLQIFRDMQKVMNQLNSLVQQRHPKNRILAPPNAADFLQRVENAHRFRLNTPLEVGFVHPGLPLRRIGELKSMERKDPDKRRPMDYGFFPRGITPSNGPPLQILDEAERKCRAERAEFEAFSQAQRAYARASRREALGADYRGTRDPWYG